MKITRELAATGIGIIVILCIIVFGAWFAKTIMIPDYHKAKQEDSERRAKYEKELQEQRFVIVHSNRLSVDNWDMVVVIKDKTTGEEFKLFRRDGSGGGTVLK